jgi:hypothetical protein
MSYTNTLIKVAADCPVSKSEIPVDRKSAKPAHVIQYELLTQNPYTFGHEDLIYEVFIRQKEIPANILETDAGKIKQALFSKGHPCMRASALTKRYGWGAHYNQEGKIAIYPQEAETYQQFMASEAIKKVPAMRSKRQI